MSDRSRLGGGQYAYVDAADYEWLSRYHWCRCGEYAARREKGQLIFMHRQIMQPPKGMVVDHIDGNKYNNCRANMRNCTHMQNVRNQAKRTGCVCRFKGVYYQKTTGRYSASTKLHGKVVWLGYFDSEAEAARAYDRKVVELFGEYAWLNFPEDWPLKKRRELHAKYLRTAESSSPRRRPKAKKPGREGGKKETVSRKKRKNPKTRKRTTIKRASKTRRSTQRKRP
jgi:hypothetical protein